MHFFKITFNISFVFFNSVVYYTAIIDMSFLYLIYLNYKIKIGVIFISSTLLNLCNFLMKDTSFSK